MNVTNIGSPVATSAAPAAGADVASGSGFAGLLGTGTADAAQGGLVFGTPVFDTFATSQPTTITAQTSAALLPGGADAGALPVASDRPQVPMTQLLATAAPITTAPIVVAGGNPLADAVAKALAKPAVPAATEAGAKASASAQAAPTADPALADPALPAQGEAPPKAAIAPVPNALLPNAGTKAAASPTAAATKAAANANQVQPPVEDAVALDAPAAPEADVPSPSLASLPAKNGGKPLRAAPSDDLPSPPDMTAAMGQAVPQPIAVPQAAAAQPASTTPATPRVTSQTKGEGTVGLRTAKVETALAGDTMPTQTTAEKATEPASAVPGQASGGAAENGAKGDGNQQPFAQQLAAVDARHAGVQPLSATLPTQAAAATTAAHTAAPAGEPVINGRVGELGRSLGVEIARKVDAGEDTLRVRLNPVELGRVEVTLAFDDSGRVQATMRADSQHTLDLLRQDAPDLGRALDQAGIRSDAGSFRFESRDGSAGSNANGQSASQQQSQSRGSNQQFQDEPDIQAAAYRPVRSDGQVDLIA